MESARKLLFEHGGFRFHGRLFSGSDSTLEPAVCIGGAFQSFAAWKQLTRSLQPARTVLLLDPPGMGTSDFVPAEYDLDFMSAAVACALDEAGIDRAALLSASYGSLVAFRCTQLMPDRVSHLAMAGIMGHITITQRLACEAHLSSIADAEPDCFAAAVEGFLISKQVRDNNRRSRAVGRLLRGELSRLGEAEVTRYIANTQRLLMHGSLDLENTPAVPSLVFTGEFDNFTTPDQNRMVAASLRGGLFTLIENAGHLCHLEQPAAVSQVVGMFLRNELPAVIAGCSEVERIGG